MKRWGVFLVFIISCFNVFSQNINVIKISDLEKRINNNTDTTYIVNFWATWCIPCIKELPDFDSINMKYKNTSVKVILVSMDFKEDLKTKLLPFIKKNKVNAEVNLLDEMDGNYFIPRVSEQWSGAIPATLIVNNKLKINHFFERKLSFDFLKSEIENNK